MGACIVLYMTKTETLALAKKARDGRTITAHIQMTPDTTWVIVRIDGAQVATVSGPHTIGTRPAGLPAEYVLAVGPVALTRAEADQIIVLDGGKVVDDKFRFRTAVEDVCKRLRNVFENWMRAEEAKARAEAERKFQAERAAAEKERQRLEAERAKKLADDPVAALTEDEPELPPIPAGPEPVRVNAGGGVGRAAGLKDVFVFEVVDYEACVHHYRNNLKIREAIEKLVAGDVKTHKMDARIPGVQVRKDRRAA